MKERVESGAEEFGNVTATVTAVEGGGARVANAEGIADIVTAVVQKRVVEVLPSASGSAPLRESPPPRSSPAPLILSGKAPSGLGVTFRVVGMKDKKGRNEMLRKEEIGEGGGGTVGNGGEGRKWRERKETEVGEGGDGKEREGEGRKGRGETGRGKGERKEKSRMNRL